MRKLTSLVALALAFTFVIGTAATTNASDKGDKKKMSKSLYERLGGKDALVAVVDDFVGRVAADARINKLFADTAADAERLARFKSHLVDQICEATSGPCKYTGKDMVAAHKGMMITEDQFNALVGDLVATLDHFKVGKTEQNELLTILGSLKPQIVGQ